MSTCRDIEPLITAVVDGEATDADRALVSGHLEECVGCRRLASGETAARRILRERARAFEVEPPPALRAGVARTFRSAAAAEPAPRARFFGTRVRPLPVWATAGVVVAVFAAVFYVRTGGSGPLVAALALDHVKCFALFEAASGPGEPVAIANRMKTAYGWTIAVPGSSRALGLHLVGGRRCFSTDGRVAHILYRHAGRPLSLFVVTGTSHAAEDLAVMGHEAMIWSRRGTTYVVLARESRDQLAGVAGYIRSVVN